MKIAKITYALLSTATLAGAVTPTAVAMASTHNDTTSSVVQSNSQTVADNEEPLEILLDSELQELIDPYVVVLGNQYILEDEASSVLTTEQMQSVRLHLSRINDLVSTLGLTIDPETREFAIHQEGEDSNIEARAAAFTVAWGGWNYIKMTFGTAEAISEFENYWYGVKGLYEDELLTEAAVEALAAKFPVIKQVATFLLAANALSTIGSTVSGRLADAAALGKSKYGNTFRLDYNYFLISTSVYDI